VRVDVQTAALDDRPYQGETRVLFTAALMK